MKKRRGAVLALAAIWLISAAVSGCTEKDAPPQKPEKSYIKWIKVADGEFSPFRMPEYMGAKGLFIQRMGAEEPEDIFFTDVKENRVSLVGSGFDLNTELHKAKAMLAEMEKDLSGMTELYLPKRNALLIQANAPELWVYHIESGALELLGDGGYTGMSYDEVYNLAFQKWGEGTYLYPYGGLRPSPGERWIAFESTLSEVSGETGQEVYLYDMSEKTERLLLTGETTGDSWQARGWVSEDQLLCLREQYKMEDGVNRGTESRQAFLVRPDGRRMELALLQNVDPEEPFSLYADSGLIVAADGKSPVSIQAYDVGSSGDVKRILDYKAEKGRLAGDAVMNASRSRLAYLNAPEADSYERELHIVSVEDGEERVIAGVDIGEGISTSVKTYHWIDDNRLLIILREEWAGQETSSAWILDLRAKTEDGQAVERDAARAEDMAKPRNDSTVAEAYMTLLERVYEESPELNGEEDALKYAAVDTSRMLSLTLGQKEALFALVGERWQVEVLDQTYTQLQEEGRLAEDGSFAEGILFQITGGFFQNNVMRAEVSKWRADGVQLILSGVTLRFENDRWTAVK